VEKPLLSGPRRAEWRLAYALCEQLLSVNALALSAVVQARHLLL
jgi:hypothetical protein